MNEKYTEIDDRAHQTYKILFELREKASWGHLPPNTGVFDFWDRIQTHIGKVYNILEYGTNLGFSAMMQLQVNPEAKITSFDIVPVPLKYGRKNLIPTSDITYGMPTELKLLESVTSQALLSLTYGKRFHYKIDSSQNIKKYASLTSLQWCYVFIDGGHTFEETVEDIDNTINVLHTDYVVIDNLLLSPVKRAVEKFVNDGLISLVDEHVYEQQHFNKEKGGWTEKVVADSLGLFKIKK